MKIGDIIRAQENDDSYTYKIEKSSTIAYAIKDASDSVRGAGTEVVYVCEIKAIVRRSVAVEE